MKRFFYFGVGILFMLLLGCSSTYHSAQEEIFQSACKSEADSKSSGTNVVTSNIVLPDTINNILTLYDDSIITVSLNYGLNFSSEAGPAKPLFTSSNLVGASKEKP